MGFREFKNSGRFVLALLGLTIVGVPFGLEQIGEVTGAFKFPASATVKGWFRGSAKSAPVAAAEPVNWEQYRKDLEKFTQWVEHQRSVDVSVSTNEIVIPPPPVIERPRPRIWSVSVTSCTAGNPVTGKPGYVYVAGIDRSLERGVVIKPVQDRCGYEIVYIGERAVWFRAIFDPEQDTPISGGLKLPEFTLVGDDFVAIGRDLHYAREAFPLESGGWLLIDSFLPPDGVLFKILDARRQEVGTLLCIVISKKGGR